MAPRGSPGSLRTHYVVKHSLESPSSASKGLELQAYTFPFLKYILTYYLQCQKVAQHTNQLRYEPMVPGKFPYRTN